jgi:hypothetical protein
MLCEENDFSLLEDALFKKYKTFLFVANNLYTHIKKVHELQEFVTHEKGHEQVKQIVAKALRLGIIAKIKYGKEIENYYLNKKSQLDPAEQEMLISALKSEYESFRKEVPETKKAIKALESAISVLKSTKSDKKKKLDAMFSLSKTYFSLQSIFLDELNITEVARLDHDERFVLTIGKDLFVASAEIKSFAFPEDFGYRRWQEVPPEPVEVIVELTPTEKFVNELMKELEEKTEILNWKETKENICRIIKVANVDDKSILQELEKHKFKKVFSFEKIFFAIAAIERAQKNTK